MTRLSTLIREKQHESGLTERDVAATFGFSQQALNNWKNGRALPRPCMYAPVAKFLGVDVSQMPEIVGVADSESESASEALRKIAGDVLGGVILRELRRAGWQLSRVEDAK